MSYGLHYLNRRQEATVWHLGKRCQRGVENGFYRGGWKNSGEHHHHDHHDDYDHDDHGDHDRGHDRDTIMMIMIIFTIMIMRMGEWLIRNFWSLMVFFKVTQDIESILKPKGFALTKRGTIAVKGKGDMVIIISVISIIIIIVITFIITITRPYTLPSYVYRSSSSSSSYFSFPWPWPWSGNLLFGWERHQWGTRIGSGAQTGGFLRWNHHGYFHDYHGNYYDISRLYDDDHD